MTENTHVFILKTLLERYHSQALIHFDDLKKGVLIPDQLFKSETLRHTKERTEQIRDTLVQDLTENTEDPKFYIDIGQICHYHSDWFCKYHREELFFDFIKHFNYEKRLHRLFKNCYEDEYFWMDVQDGIREMKNLNGVTSLGSKIHHLIRCYNLYYYKYSEREDGYADVLYSTVSVLITLKYLLKGDRTYA